METDSEGQCVPLSETQLDFPGEPYSVSVLKVGFCLPQTDGTFRADGTVTLITGLRTVLVDTGGPWDRDFLLRSLKDRGLDPGDVDVVVGTHGHSDHVGNLNLFPAALLIVGHDVSEGNTYRPNQLAEGQSYSIDEHVSVSHVSPCVLANTVPGDLQVCVCPTPGHTGQDVSVQVKGTSAGTVLVAGDLFECCNDESSWRDVSMNPAVQEVSRQEALRTADVIIPGHGPPFRVLRK
ncbi:metallo-beta-lactamase domain-containing protein 1 isoform X1 [Embiotoca jacksoni]|uniref:metallo-beta-lactamase domain-containing protein 1 isoform X1 n=1 Tax=Embiotoca jacksoni TaxID=100190 RepID=UPI003703CD0B